MTKKPFRRFIPIVLILLLLTIAIMSYYFIYLSTPPFKAQIKFANLPNAKIAYYTRGKGSTILLLPGFAMTMQDWDPQVLRQLSTHHKLIIFDYRGVGKSNGDLNNLSEDELATDTVELMSKLKIKKTDLLGWSLGSFIAQRITEKYPERVNKLVLIATGPGSDKMILSSNASGTTIQNNLNGSWETVYVPLMFPDTTDGKLASQNYLNRINTAVQNEEIPNDQGGDPSARAMLEQALSNTQLEQNRTTELSTIKIPTLIITGQNDTLIPIQNDKFVTNRILNAQLQIIPDAGHAVLFQYPDQLSQMINQFLQ